jgi:hypothetical protein
MPWVAAAVAVVGALATASISAALMVRDRPHEPGGPPVQAIASCARAVHVVTSSSFAPVLARLAGGLSRAPDCVHVGITVANGRSGAGRVQELRADAWIPDDASWASTAMPKLLAPDGVAGAGAILATSPIYMVTDPSTARRIERAGGSWLALAGLLNGRSGVRLAVRDPAGSGDGMVAAGDLAESVWLDKGMDASAMALATALPVIRTVRGAEPALPTRSAEVGLVPEYALLSAPAWADRLIVLGGTDHTALLRFAWLPTAAAAADPGRAAALRRVLSTLTGSDAGGALDLAGLRRPNGPPPSRAPVQRLPRSTAAPYEVLGPHHVGHVFAAWYARDRLGSLLVVVDVSGSMASPAPGTRTPLIDLVRQGCRSVGGLLPDDGYLGLWAFGSRLDPPRDYRTLLPIRRLAAAHRQALSRTLDALAPRPTGTGLYDTILAAYRTATAAYRPGMPNEVLVFTDGRNEEDPGSISPAQLAAGLSAATDRRRPVLLTVVAFGSRPETGVLEEALKPVDGYVESTDSAAAVAAAFVHVAASGLHGG